MKGWVFSFLFTMNVCLHVSIFLNRRDSYLRREVGSPILPGEKPCAF